MVDKNQKIMMSNALLFAGYLFILIAMVLRLFFNIEQLSDWLPYCFVFGVALFGVGRVMGLTSGENWKERRVNGYFAIGLIAMVAAAVLFFMTRNSWVVAVLISLLIDFMAFIRREQLNKK